MRNFTRDRKFLFLEMFLAMIALLTTAGIAQAQGSRKDDIVFNAQGHPMAGATIHVCTSAATGEPCSPSAAIYSDVGLTQALANPFTADGLGNYSFYAAPGRYEIEVSGPGITTMQFPNVILPSDPSTPTFTTVTTTSGISAFSLSLTGNLTVSGSTSVAGTLSVGGAPVPSATAANQWTASQSFKGPIPWRDFTAYMKDSNGNPVNCSTTSTAIGADTTGTISLSTPNTLTLASALDFKNGCGIAVLHAGPTSTIVTPPSSMAVSTVVSAANVVTVTTSSNHGLIVGSGNGNLQGVQVSGCSNSAYNGTFPIQSIASSTTFTYDTASSGIGSATGCTMTASFGYAHGVSGSSGYSYEVVAIDANMGYSAASTSPVTITNGNATLSKYNYNHIMWPLVTGAYMYGIYMNSGSGYNCVGTAFTNAYSDFGLPLPCPVFLPSTPPASAGPQTLNTTITAGGGTSALTLAASASNSVTSQNVYHDESSFLNSCINDVIGDQNSPVAAAQYGCYIPAGRYGINGMLLTGTTSTTYKAVNIYVAGLIHLQTIPLFFTQNGYHMQGVGGGGYSNVFNHTSQTSMMVASTVPAVAVFNGALTNSFSNFSISSLYGHGVWLGNSAGIVLNSLDLSEQTSGTGGAPLVIDWNTFAVYGNDDTFQAEQTNGGLPAIMISLTPYNSMSGCCWYFNGLSSSVHGISISGPGGNGTGGQNINTLSITNWIEENLAPLDVGLITYDSGPNAPGASQSSWGFGGLTLNKVNNSDTSGSAVLVYAGTGNALTNVTLTDIAGSNTVAECVNGSPICNSPIQIPGYFSANGPSRAGNFGTGNGFGVNETFGPTVVNTSREPLYFTEPYGGNSPQIPAWAEILPAPYGFTVTGTGSGSLAANTYCMQAVGLDANSNETNGSNIVCQTVSASASITAQWTQGVSGALNQAYSGFTFYYCSTSGTSCTPNEKITGLGASGNPVSYTFTSTSSGVAGSPNDQSLAYLSWLGWDRNTGPYSCFFCVSSSSDLWPVGFGMVPTANLGINLFTAKGIRAGTQYQASESTAPSGVASIDELWADSTAHQWKKIENNGAAFNVAGTLSGTTGSIGGSALTAGQCASGTVSVSNASTSMTVSVSPNTYPGDGFIPWGYVSASGTVTVKVCAQASGTPTSSTYNVRVIQ